MTYEELVNSGKSIGNMTNDELITYCSGLLDEIWEYDKRFDRAIEYINKHKKPLHHYFDEPDCDYWIATNPDDILDILKGSDKE